MNERKYKDILKKFFSLVPSSVNSNYINRTATFFKKYLHPFYNEEKSVK